VSAVAWGMAYAFLCFLLGRVLGRAERQREMEADERECALDALAGDDAEPPVARDIHCPLCTYTQASVRPCQPGKRINGCGRRDHHLHAKCNQCGGRYLIKR
jgi:hypothetical protein